MLSTDPPPADPAAEIALSHDEIDWLRDLLSSDEVPDTAMPLEALDGFLTALAIGPDIVPQAEYMPVIWDATEPVNVLEDDEQSEFLEELLLRHSSTIALRSDVGYPHLPLLEDERPGQDGCAWCYGFMVGIGMRLKAWQPLLRSRKMAPLMALISVLAEADELSDMEAAAPEHRAEVLEALSAIPVAVRAFWRDREAGRHERDTLISTKIGRNEPCPCGSGRKYKRCCGAGGRNFSNGDTP